MDPESHLAEPLVRELMRGSGEAGAAQGTLRNTECSSCLFEVAQSGCLSHRSEFKYPPYKRTRSRYKVGFRTIYRAICCSNSKKSLTLNLLCVFLYVNRQRSFDVWEWNGPHTHSQPNRSSNPCDGQRRTKQFFRLCLHGYRREHCEPNHFQTGEG